MKVSMQQVMDEIYDVSYHRLGDSTVTVCLIKLKNGFTVTGQSACVDPAEYNKEIGEQIAYKRAEDAIWSFLGFRLADNMMAAHYKELEGGV
jgi:hypothetical protein